MDAAALAAVATEVGRDLQRPSLGEAATQEAIGKGAEADAS